MADVKWAMDERKLASAYGELPLSKTVLDHGVEQVYRSLDRPLIDI